MHVKGTHNAVQSKQLSMPVMGCLTLFSVVLTLVSCACCHRICAGGMVPASLRAGLPASSVTVDIKNGHSDVSVLPVDAGTKITWNFKVAANDVNFFAFFAPASVNVDAMDMRKMCAIPYGNPVIVAPSRISQASGEYIAKSEGHVVLVCADLLLVNRSCM